VVGGIHSRTIAILSVRAYGESGHSCVGHIPCNGDLSCILIALQRTKRGGFDYI